MLRLVLGYGTETSRTHEFRRRGWHVCSATLSLRCNLRPGLISDSTEREATRSGTGISSKRARGVDNRDLVRLLK